MKDSKVLSIGITNQRETTVVWDKETEKPLYNAIVWHDTRTSKIIEELIKKNDNDKFKFQKKCGLPLSTYFSASKLKWLIENVKFIFLINIPKQILSQKKFKIQLKMELVCLVHLIVG